MSEITPVVVMYDMVTPYGWGVDNSWKGILSSKTAITHVDRFKTDSFLSSKAGIISDIKFKEDQSLVMQMLAPILSKAVPHIPDNATLFLSSTNGEIEYIQQYILNKSVDPAKSRLDYLLKKVKNLSRINGPSFILSSACASSTTALAYAASMIRSGDINCALVTAVDCVSEFVFAGFSALMALDPDIPRPFDKNRKGLSVGEGAGFVLLMSRKRAIKENRQILGEIAGWGITNDAVHMTAPSNSGKGLVSAIQKSLKSANIDIKDIGSICAHGTGTVYNDAMEINAFKKVFKKNRIPVYSIKGGTGHTLAATGLIETIISFESLKTGIIPGTINLINVDDQAKAWVSPNQNQSDADFTISTNSGFGGVNAVLVLKKGK